MEANGLKLEVIQCPSAIEMYTWSVVEIARDGVLCGKNSEQTKNTYCKLYEPHTQRLYFLFHLQKVQKQKPTFGDRSQIVGTLKR